MWAFTGILPFIDNHYYFLRNNGELYNGGLQTGPKSPIRRIIHEICNNRSKAFAGFGRHTANDLLYLSAIFPGTPAYIICQNSECYEKFKDLIYTYQSQFSDPEYHHLVSTSPNTDNPFAFNENSNRLYIERYIMVFWHTTAFVPNTLYDQYRIKDYLDPNHYWYDSSQFSFFLFCWWPSGQPYAPIKWWHWGWL